MNEGVSKKEQASQRFSANIGVFRCPICGDGFVANTGGVRCSHNHSFDLARKGYLSLFTGPQATQYDKDLFLAPREVFAAGVYDPLVREIVDLVNALNLEKPLVLDAGCGEGSFLARFHECVRDANLLGIDISRDGIELATSYHEAVMWCVADITRLPLRSKSTDVVLSILSPANYREFQRVLKPSGVVIKVLPGEDYLREIRQRLGGIAPYSNDEVLAKLEDSVDVHQKSPLHYKVDVTPKFWKAMVQMTPLSKHREVVGEPPESLTIDLQIIQGAMV